MLGRVSLFASLAVAAFAFFPESREIFQDVNKGASPSVNIIVDRSSDAGNLAQILSSERRARSSFLSAPVLGGLEAKLRSMFQGENAPEIRQLLSDSLIAAAATEGVSAGSMACARNYSGCPSGWAAAAGGACLAPENYSGACGTSLSLSGLSAKERQMAADSCGASFSCA